MATATPQVTDQIYNIPLSEILIDNEFNCRGVDGLQPMGCVDLASDIAERGLIQPVIVAPLTQELKWKYPQYNYKLIAGFRRTVAHKINNMSHIKAIVRDDLTDEIDALAFNFSENLNRQELDILQEARTIMRLKHLGLKREDLAKKIGKSWGWIQVRFYLTDLPAEIQAEIKGGFINQQSIRVLRSILETSGTDKCIEAAKKLKDKKLRGVKGTVKLTTGSKELKSKSLRTKTEIERMQDYIRKTCQGNNTLTRLCAWHGGYITMQEWLDSFEEFCNENGFEFEYPDFLELEKEGGDSDVRDAENSSG